MIRINNLNKTYFGATPLHVLKGINLNIDKGEFLSIMGASGSGKSTLLNILGILDSYDTGEYYLDNTLIKNVSETKAAELRNKKIGFIFQSFNLIPFKNAMENVALPLYYQGVSRKKRNMLALEYLDKMGLKSHADHLPNEMSGGQKQRVAIARALIAQPQIILADEPTGALDSKTSEDVMNLLREINTVDGITMIIVTHEKAVAEATDRIIHIKDGLINNIEDRKLLKKEDSHAESKYDESRTINTSISVNKNDSSLINIDKSEKTLSLDNKNISESRKDEGINILDKENVGVVLKLTKVETKEIIENTITSSITSEEPCASNSADVKKEDLSKPSQQNTEQESVNVSFVKPQKDVANVPLIAIEPDMVQLSQFSASDNNTEVLEDKNQLISESASESENISSTNSSSQDFILHSKTGEIKNSISTIESVEIQPDGLQPSIKLNKTHISQTTNVDNNKEKNILKEAGKGEDKIPPIAVLLSDKQIGNKKEDKYDIASSNIKSVDNKSNLTQKSKLNTSLEEVKNEDKKIDSKTDDGKNDKRKPDSNRRWQYI